MRIEERAARRRTSARARLPAEDDPGTTLAEADGVFVGCRRTWWTRSPLTPARRRLASQHLISGT